MLEDEENLEEEKLNGYVLGKLKPKMTYSTTLYLSHTLQDFEDLYDSKSCALPTLVENDMPSKPMKSYTLNIMGSPCECEIPISL